MNTESTEAAQRGTEKDKGDARRLVRKVGYGISEA
jgi:hypothetical protein